MASITATTCSKWQPTASSATKENEEKVLNLHNHLIWKSYERGKDDVTDAIIDEAERLAESEESSPFALR